MRLIIAGLICALGVLTAFCRGDDDNVTNTPDSTRTGQSAATNTPGDGTSANQTYFTALEAYFGDSGSRSDEATSILNDDLNAATTLDEEKAAINRFLDTMTLVFDAAVSTMNNLDPPYEAAFAHDTFRNDISLAQQTVESLKVDLADASTQEAAQAVVNDFNDRVKKLVDNAQVACRDLQATADEQNASVELQCQSE